MAMIFLDKPTSKSPQEVCRRLMLCLCVLQLLSPLFEALPVRSFVFELFTQLEVNHDYYYHYYYDYCH